MATHLMGGYSYEGCYAIEAEGELFGPFMGQVEAHTFALERFEPPYTLRLLLSPKTSPLQGVDR